MQEDAAIDGEPEAQRESAALEGSRPVAPDSDVLSGVDSNDIERRSHRLRRLLQNLSDVVTLVDREGRVLWSSPTSERIFGPPPGAGEESTARVHPDDAERVATEFHAQLEAPPFESGDARPEPSRFRLLAADGSWRHVESYAANLLEDPEIRAIVVTTRDVTEQVEAGQRLRTSEERYRAIVEDQSELIVRYSPDGVATFANEAFARYFDTTVERVVGRALLETAPSGVREAARLRAASLGKGRRSVSYEHRMPVPDGHPRYQQWTDRAVLDADGRLVEIQSVGRDVTEGRMSELLVADQARVLEKVATGAPLADTLADVCRVVEHHVAGAACQILLVEEATDVLRHAAAPTLPADLARGLDGLPVAVLSVDDPQQEPLAGGELPTPDPAAPVLRWWRAHPIPSSVGDRVLGAVVLFHPAPRDPSPSERRLVEQVAQVAQIAIERHRFETQLAHQARYDHLTGLPNRPMFVSYLTKALARAQRSGGAAAVLFVDLDRFKVVNDSLGHEAGDEILVAIAERLRQVVRPGDTVARFGGDEFTILCEDLTAARRQAADVAERVIDAVRRPLRLRGEEYFLGASVGISIGFGPPEIADRLLSEADAAMYRAKERGGGSWELFDDAMRASAVARLETVSALHHAMDRGELRLHYQPVVSLQGARLAGVEALVRWEHPERGLIAPAQFVSVAEESGLARALGDWVMGEACREAAGWPRLPDGRLLTVSVNVSGRELVQKDLTRRVRRALEQSGLPPEQLSLEITENVLMRDVDGTIETVKELKALGVSLTIDDFGTGSSSFANLKRLPVDAVKVDGSFVGGMVQDPEDAAIVAAIMSLGHALGLQVVAEGVETWEQLRGLVALRCDLAQGYYFSRPLEPGALAGMLQETAGGVWPGSPFPDAEDMSRRAGG